MRARYTCCFESGRHVTLGQRRSWRERVVSYGLLAPATVLFAIFMFYPLPIRCTRVFLLDMTAHQGVCGLETLYFRIYDPAFGKILGNTGRIFCSCWYLTVPHRMSFHSPVLCVKKERILQKRHFSAQRHLPGGGNMIFVGFSTPISGPVHSGQGRNDGSSEQPPRFWSSWC